MNRAPRFLVVGILALVATAAISSPARADRAARQVVAWYERYLDRYPNDAGARDWVEKLRRGRDPLDVEASILSSDEYWRRAGSNPAGFVDRLFRDTAGRPPGPGEFRYWVGRARSGDRKQIAVDFLKQLYGDRPWN
jgi:hypothetical protein